MKKLLPIVLVAILLLGILPFVGVSDVYASNVKEARKHAEEKLLPLKGVAGISHSEDPPRIIVYIEDEKYKGKIPKKFEGFDTEVEVTGRIEALALAEVEGITTLQYQYPSPVSRTGIVRPILGGISCGVPQTTYGGKMAGTLGVVTNDPYILSCAHVIAMNNRANFLPLGTPVLQPGTYDGGTTSNKVGELYKYIKITFGWGGSNYADAAIAKLTAGEYSKMEQLGGDNLSTYTISGSTTVSINDIIRKSGRTTGVTENQVTNTGATVKVYYTSYKYAIFKDQILVKQPFIQSGDSGSLVDKGGKFVGLAFAGSSTVGVVCKANYIIAGLGISVG